MKTVNIKKIFLTFFLVAIVVSLCLPVVMLASPARAVWIDTNSTCTKTGDCNVCDLVAVAVRFVNGNFLGAGIFAMFMFAFGGIVMLISYGNENRITWGKNIIIAAVIGTFIIFTAWILVNVFIGAFFGTPLGKDAIPIFKNSWNVCPAEMNQSQTPNAQTSNKFVVPGK